MAGHLLSSVLILGAALLFATVGCNSDPRLNTEYGKIATRGSTASTASLNGTRVLAEMFRQQGVVVNRQSVISPRLNRYQTIVWFPDRHQPPSEEVVVALENWLNNGYSRTLIYVGRDYDGSLSYLEQIRDQANVAKQEELFRLVAESIVERATYNQEFATSELSRECDWFSISRSRRVIAKAISAPLAEGVDTKACHIELATILSPKNDDESEDLLIVDGNPFAFVLPQVGYSQGQIIVVSNGSFLLNFGLVNQENRKLARNLINQCDSSGSVVFLESGPGEISIKEKPADHQPWAWISQPPLRYVVPHVLFWGVLFCFVLFPIYGRARRFRPSGNHNKDRRSGASIINEEQNDQSIHRFVSTTSFRNHIVALGKLLERSESPRAAIDKVKHYQETFGKDSPVK